MYGIFTYIYHRNQPNVGRYTNLMDPMGNILFESATSVFRFQSLSWNVSEAKTASLFTTSLTPLSENNSACTSEKKHVLGLLKIIWMASSLV